MGAVAPVLGCGGVGMSEPMYKVNGAVKWLALHGLVVSRWWIHRRIDEGKLTPSKPGGAYLIPESQLVALLETPAGCPPIIAPLERRQGMPTLAKYGIFPPKAGKRVRAGALA